MMTKTMHLSFHLCYKSCVSRTEIQHFFKPGNHRHIWLKKTVMFKITGLILCLITSKTCFTTLAPVTKYRMQEDSRLALQFHVISATQLCSAYTIYGNSGQLGRAIYQNPRKSLRSSKGLYLNSHPCDTIHSKFSLDESTSVAACNSLLNKPPTQCSC